MIKAPLIPVTAEDAAREKRRSLVACVSAAVLVLGIAGWIYKRSLDPIHAQESFDSGQRLLAVARYNQAILSFDRTVALQPQFQPAYLLRGRARAGLSDTERAVEDFSKAISLNPRDSLAILDRGRAYLDLKNYSAAMKDSEAAIGINPRLAAAHNLRGTVLRETGHARAAIEAFNQAVELAPNADNYYQRGATYQLLGEHRLALADFDQTIAFEPAMAHAYFARAESRRAVGDMQGAEKDHRYGRALDGR
jgi:tetratricopeptide (TPR) repeat protein